MRPNSKKQNTARISMINLWSIAGLVLITSVLSTDTKADATTAEILKLQRAIGENGRYVSNEYRNRCRNFALKVLNQGFQRIQGIDLMKFIFEDVGKVTFVALNERFFLEFGGRGAGLNVCSSDDTPPHVILNATVQALIETDEDLVGAMCMHEALGALCIDDEEFQITTQMYWLAKNQNVYDHPVTQEIFRRQDTYLERSGYGITLRYSFEALGDMEKANMGVGGPREIQIARSGSGGGEGKGQRRKGKGSGTHVGSGGDFSTLQRKMSLLHSWGSYPDRDQRPRISTILDCPLQVIEPATFQQMYRQELPPMAVSKPFNEWVALDINLTMSILGKYDLDDREQVFQAIEEMNRRVDFPILRSFWELEQQRNKPECLR